jgi:hypothetical protein
VYNLGENYTKGGAAMRSFDEFAEYCEKFYPELTYEIVNGIKDVPEDQRTISKSEWEFIEQLIFRSNLAFLRWYHENLHEEQN